MSSELHKWIDTGCRQQHSAAIRLDDNATGWESVEAEKERLRVEAETKLLPELSELYSGAALRVRFNVEVKVREKGASRVSRRRHKVEVTNNAQSNEERGRWEIDLVQRHITLTLVEPRSYSLPCQADCGNLSLKWPHAQEALEAFFSLPDGAPAPILQVEQQSDEFVHVRAEPPRNEDDGARSYVGAAALDGAPLRLCNKRGETLGDDFTVTLQLLPKWTRHGGDEARQQALDGVLRQLAYTNDIDVLLPQSEVPGSARGLSFGLLSYVQFLRQMDEFLIWQRRRYQRRESVRTGIKGRMLVSAYANHVARAEPHRVPCAYAELDRDTPENVILHAAFDVVATATRRLSERDSIASMLQPWVNRLATTFAGIPLRHVTPRDLTTLRPQIWNDERYGPALQAAERVLRNLHPSWQHPEQARQPAFLLDAIELYESYVRGFLQHIAARERLPVRVWSKDEAEQASKQSSMPAIVRTETGNPLTFKPDLLLTTNAPARRLLAIGDVKYKLPNTRSSYDPLRREDMFQLLSYVLAFDAPAGLLVMLGKPDDARDVEPQQPMFYARSRTRPIPIYVLQLDPLQAGDLASVTTTEITEILRALHSADEHETATSHKVWREPG